LVENAPGGTDPVAVLQAKACKTAIFSYPTTKGSVPLGAFSTRGSVPVAGEYSSWYKHIVDEGVSE